jgi:hypothetical protein
VIGFKLALQTWPFQLFHALINEGAVSVVFTWHVNEFHATCMDETARGEISGEGARKK